MSMSMSIGQRIKHLRNLHNLTQEELAYKLGVNKATVNRYEAGIIDIKRTVALTLSGIFGVSPAYLMGWTDDAEIRQTVELTKDENALISKYRSLNADGKQKADEYITDLSEQEKYTAIDSEK